MKLHLSSPLVVLLLLAAVGLPVALSAEPTESGQAAKPAVTADANQDGKVSREEFVDAMADRVMQRLDGNQDGSLSREEAAKANEGAQPKGKAAKEQAKIDFDKADSNKDGKLDRKEVRKALADDKGLHSYFEQRAKDRDGFLQPYETETMDTFGYRFKF